MPERRHSSWTIWLIDKEIYFRAVVFDIPREDFRICCFKHRLLEAQSIANEALSLRLREEDFERWLFHWQANCGGQLPSDVAKEMIDLAAHAHIARLRMILGISVHGT
jgi:hypothetical protein